MKNFGIVFFLFKIPLLSNAQNNKPLQISEFRLREFNYPVYVIQDKVANSYFVNWFGNGQIISDTVSVYKLSPSGKLLKRLKINSLYGGLSNNSLIRINENKFLVAISFTDSIKIQNTVYKVRYNNNNLIGVSGSILVEFDSNLEITNHYYLGLGVNLYPFSINNLSNKNFTVDFRFTDTLDLRPLGGNLIVTPSPNYATHLNFCSVELDSNFRYKSSIHSSSRGFVEICYNTSYLKTKKITGGRFAFGGPNVDSLRVDGKKYGSNLVGDVPFLFRFDANQKIKWSLIGSALPNSSIDGTSIMGNIVEDKDENFYAVFLNYGIFKFGTATLGKPNDYSTSIIKFDSLSNILWSKTFSTFGGYVYQNELILSYNKDRIIYTAALQDTFSIGSFNFALEPDDKKKGFIAEIDLEGNVENVTILGYEQPISNGINFMTANMDSLGNTYAFFTTQGTGEFKQDCFTLPELTSLENDSSRVVWLKFGPSTLKKDSILKQWDICDGFGQIEARYKTKYPDLQYKWNNQTVDSTFTFSQGGNYRLIVKDATCYADTNYFSFAPKAIIVEPTIIGSNQANNISSFLYHISVPDSLQINWQVSGGQIVSGQGSDSLYVNWANTGTGIVSYTVRGSLSGCQKTDSLTVLITAQNEIQNYAGATTIQPNPTNDFLTIFTKRIGKVYYSLRNILGQQIDNGDFVNGQKQLTLYKCETGIYFLELISETGKETFKVVKR